MNQIGYLHARASTLARAFEGTYATEASILANRKKALSAEIREALANPRGDFSPPQLNELSRLATNVKALAPRKFKVPYAHIVSGGLPTISRTAR